MKRELGIARCGLACCLCSENVTCKGCKRDGFMKLSCGERKDERSTYSDVVLMMLMM